MHEFSWISEPLKQAKNTKQRNKQTKKQETKRQVQSLEKQCRREIEDTQKFQGNSLLLDEIQIPLRVDACPRYMCTRRKILKCFDDDIDVKVISEQVMPLREAKIKQKDR